MIYVIDDDREFAECIAKMIKAFGEKEVKIFGNGIEATEAINEELPKMIFLDILLDGPDGFTFLNELMSYSDTEKIPIVIMSSLRLQDQCLKSYGVVKVLDKAEMVPADIEKLMEKYGGQKNKRF